MWVDKSHGVGMDLRFPNDAFVIINTMGEFINKEDLFQFFSRGSRSMGRFDGLLMHVEKPYTQHVLLNNIYTHSGPDFKDLSQNLKVCREVELRFSEDLDKYRLLTEAWIGTIQMPHNNWNNKVVMLWDEDELGPWSKLVTTTYRTPDP